MQGCVVECHGRQSTATGAGVKQPICPKRRVGHTRAVGPAASDWNAVSYDRVADPQARWGAEVLMRLPLAGDERVLDAGCGTGRVTQLLLTRVPRGEVVALDASAAMLDEARKRLAQWRSGALRPGGPRAATAHHEPVDAILSTATFHWVPDHDALFANLAAVLRPGGGSSPSAAASATSRGSSRSRARSTRTSPGTGTTSRPRGDHRAARASGFVEIRTWLSDAPTPFEPGRAVRGVPRDGLPAVPSRRLPAAEREPSSARWRRGCPSRSSTTSA